MNSDVSVLTGIVDQIPFESASKSAKDYNLKYKSSLDVKGKNNEMIKYKYSGEYSIYDNNETKQELINIKIDAGTFSPTYKIHTECKKEELDDLLKARYTR